MTRPSRIGERPSASRIDDLGSPHIPVSPEIGLFQGDDILVAARGPAAHGRRLAESRDDAVEHSHRLGRSPHWPVLTRPRLAGFGCPRRA
jgi:hypothetical protein